MCASRKYLYPTGKVTENSEGEGGGGWGPNQYGVVGTLMEKHNVNVRILLLVRVPLYKILELISTS